MTHVPPGAAMRRPPHVPLTSLRPAALSDDRSRLHDALAAHRAAIAALETAWVAASEHDAARGLGRTVRIDDRATWDKATWQRYLTAATTREPDYKPRIMRLLREIDNLEALLAMPMPAQAA